MPLSVLLPGADQLEWRELEHGRHGYRQGIAAGAVQVYYDGQPGSGTHVHLSGQACRELEQSGVLGDDPADGWRNLFRHVLDSEFHVSRADYALDDRAGELDMNAIGVAAAAGAYTSKWHRWREERQGDGNGYSESRTFTFGSRSSNSLLRIYDKRAERLEAGEDPGDAPWVRVELQLRDEQAMAMVRQLVDAGGAAAPVLGVIRGHLEFKEPVAGDSNKRRWPVAPWWAAFLQHASKRRLGIGRPLRTLDSVRRWLDRQVSPSLALMYRSWERSPEMLRRFLEDGDARLRPKDLALLKAG